MSVGTIGDNTIDARNMKNLFEEKGLKFTYLEVNEAIHGEPGEHS